MGRFEEIQKRLAEIKEEIKTRGAGITADEVEKLDKEIDVLEAEKRGILDAEEKRSKMLGKIAAGKVPATTVSARSFPGMGAVKTGDDDTDPADPYGSIEYRKAFKRFVTTGQAIPAELRADQIIKTDDANIMLPTTVLNRIVESLSTAGNILSLVTKTSFKGGLSVPTSSVKPTATWVTEGKGSDKQKKKVNYIVFTWNKLRCAVAMTLEMETMALPIFEQTIVANIIEAMTIALETAVISGDGNGKPKGILAETVDDKKTITLTDTAVTFKSLTDAEAALSAEYDNKAEWCMSKSTLVQCMTITDNNKQPIFRNIADSNGKLTPVILGRKVNVTSYVPALAADTAAETCVAFMFDFKDYILNMNKQITMKKYTDEDTDDEIMKAVALADGKCVSKESLVKVVTGAAK